MRRLLALIAALPLMAFATAQERIITLGGDVTGVSTHLGQSQRLSRDSTSQWPSGSGRSAGCRLFAPTQYGRHPFPAPHAGARQQPGAAVIVLQRSGQ